MKQACISENITVKKSILTSTGSTCELVKLKQQNHRNWRFTYYGHTLSLFSAEIRQSDCICVQAGDRKNSCVLEYWSVWIQHCGAGTKWLWMREWLITSHHSRGICPLCPGCSTVPCLEQRKEQTSHLTWQPWGPCRTARGQSWTHGLTAGSKLSSSLPGRSVPAY